MESDMIQAIPLPGYSGTRKTGPMAFEGDWPGVFIRGDEAGGFLIALQLLVRPSITGNSREAKAARMVCEELAGILASCRVGQDWRDG